MFLPLSTSITALAAALLQRTPQSVPPGTLIPSINGECGGVQTCAGSAFGVSCSKWGYCGSTVEYSGAGCQSMFGICDEGEVAVATSLVYATVTSECAALQSACSTPPPVTVVAPKASGTKAYDSAGTTSTICETAYTTNSSLTPISASSTSSSETPSASTSVPSNMGNEDVGPDSVPYKAYAGSGTGSEGWPDSSAWLSFATLWEVNQELISGACAQYHVQENSASETEEVKKAIQSVAQSSAVDERFIFTVLLQESTGCVRAPTTQNAVFNPGLMQSSNGAGSCNPGTIASPAPQNECFPDEIALMVRDGVIGTREGSMSLVAALNTAGSSDVSKFYKAARIYNSGSISPSGLLDDCQTVKCYSSDIANRLLGWSMTAKACPFDP